MNYYLRGDATKKRNVGENTRQHATMVVDSEH